MSVLTCELQSTQMSTDRQTDKEDTALIHHGIQLSRGLSMDRWTGGQIRRTSLYTMEYDSVKNSAASSFVDTAGNWRRLSEETGQTWRQIQHACTYLWDLKS